MLYPLSDLFCILAGCERHKGREWNKKSCIRIHASHPVHEASSGSECTHQKRRCLWVYQTCLKAGLWERPSLVGHCPSRMVLLLPPLPPLNDHYHSQDWLTTSAIHLYLDNILTLSPQQTPVTSICLALTPPSYNLSLLLKLSPWQITTFQQNRPTICQPDNTSLTGQLTTITSAYTNLL